MAERRPTLAVARVGNLGGTSADAWRNRIADQGLNTLDVSYRHAGSVEDVKSHIEASLGLLVLNREIDDGTSWSRQVHRLSEEKYGIRIAHEFGLSVFLAGDPGQTGELSSEEAAALQPYELIESEDLSIIRQRLIRV
jgi:hypothetical protein